MKVYLNQNEKANTVYIELDVQVGRSVENKNNRGISHLVEHMVFRDRRIPFNDYLDYFYNNGATYVNARTSLYKTTYMIKLLPDKIDFIIKNFSKMMFDKNITNEDLKNEKGALQTEIGEPSAFDNFLKNIYPKDKNVFFDDFNISRDLYDTNKYIEQVNNYKFTIDDVLKHYNKYYYPKNMTLKISGNFNNKDIKILIKENFGKYEKEGNLKSKINSFSFEQNLKPSIIYNYGNRNKSFIAYKLRLKKYLVKTVLNLYLDGLATRLQQKLRNTHGTSYSIHEKAKYVENAYIFGIVVDGLEKSFIKNKNFIEKFIKNDIKNINTKIIKKIKKDHEQMYLSIEKDSSSLMWLINNLEYIKLNYNEDKSPYELFNNLSNEDIKNIIKTSLKEESKYIKTMKEYVFFKYDNIVYTILELIISGFIIISILKYISNHSINNYCYRNIIFTRQLSNKIFLILPIILAFVISSIISQWIFEFITHSIFNLPTYIESMEYPYFIVVDLFYDSISIIIFVILYLAITFNYYSKIEISNNKIYIIGNKIKEIKIEDIQSIEVVNWSILNYFKTYGTTILFAKKTLLIKSKDGSEYFFKSNNASFLYEDILKTMDMINKKVV